MLGKIRNFFGLVTLDPLTGRMPCNLSVGFQSFPGKGSLNAVSDMNKILRLDPESLEIVEEYDYSHFHPRYRNAITSSHGAYDEDTAEFFNYSQSLGIAGEAEYTIFRIDPSGKGTILASFKESPCYLHSFALTSRFVILIMFPCHINAMRLIATKQLLQSLQFKPELKTKFMVVSRETGGVVAMYEHDAFFCFHTVNAFECGDDIEIDLCRYDDTTILKDLEMENLRSMGRVTSSHLVRFTLPNVSAANKRENDEKTKVRSRQLLDVGIEFVCLSSSMHRKNHRYIYGLSNKEGRQHFGELLKVDLLTKETKSWYPEGTFIGEPLFIENPNGVREDDGCVCVMVLDAITAKSSLVFLDASTMTEVARALAPIAISFGFHGLIN